jgi:protein gp37
MSTATGSTLYTQVTWGPVTGCDQVSAGCDNCYALRLARRLKGLGNPSYQVDGNPTTSGPGFDVGLHPAVLGQPHHWRKPRIVFVAPMGDLFHARVPVSYLRDVFTVMAETPQHLYQVATKRPARARKLADRLDWPGNLWLGTSVESRDVLHRIDDLRGTPAALRFVFFEPLLGPVGAVDLDGIGWVSAGGEGGLRSRPVQPEWVTGVRDQCLAADIPFFFKQWGGRRSQLLGRTLEGRTWNEMPPGVEVAPNRFNAA